MTLKSEIKIIKQKILFEWGFKTNQVQDEKLSELLQNWIEKGFQNHAESMMLHQSK